MDKAATLTLEGPLTMTTARRHLDDGRVLAAAGDLRVDCSALTESDSATLALLFDWLRVARRAGHRLEVRGLAEGLRSLAELYGVADLLPMQDGGPHS
ncbi:MAG: STAS domain-containing protein [Rhodocyclales bacterium]|nr:STAS domain-containing protein [Rhodocyclales bacterium]